MDKFTTKPLAVVEEIPRVEANGTIRYARCAHCEHWAMACHLGGLDSVHLCPRDDGPVLVAWRGRVVLVYQPL